MTRAQRLDEGITLHGFCARHVDQARARLHQRQSLTVDKVAGRGIGWKLRNDPVALGEQVMQRPIGYAESLFFARRQPRALEIQDVHSERGGAQRNLAADLSQSDDADGAAVQAAGSRNASKVSARDMPAVE